MMRIAIESAALAGLVGLGEAALRAMALAVMAGVALTLFRINQTSTRLLLWTVVLVAALAMPGLNLLLPAVPLRALSVTMADPGSRLPSDPITQSLAPQRDVTPTLDTSVARPPQSSAVSWPLLLCIVYATGVLVLLARAVIGWCAARRLERASVSIDDESARTILNTLAMKARVARIPRIRESAACLTPVTMRVFRPVIVLPTDWREWPGTTLEAVVIHELAHVARRDAVTQRLSLIHRAVFWFSPLGWWLHQQLGQLAEYASDEAVLAGGVNQTTYAEALLGFFALGRDRRRGTWAALKASDEHLAMAQGSGPGRRVQRIFAWKNGQSHRLTRPVALAIALGAVPVVTVAAAIQPGRVVVNLPAVPSLNLSPVGAQWNNARVDPRRAQQPTVPVLNAERQSPAVGQPQPVDYSGHWRLAQEPASRSAGELGDAFTATQDVTKLVIDVAGHHDVYTLDGSENRNRGVVRLNGTRWQEMVSQVTFEGRSLVMTSRRPTTAEVERLPAPAPQTHAVVHRPILPGFRLDTDLDFAEPEREKVHATLRAKVVLSLNADGSLVVEETVSITPLGKWIPQSTTTTRRIYRKIG